MPTLGTIISRMREAGESQENIDATRAEYERLNTPKPRPSLFNNPTAGLELPRGNPEPTEPTDFWGGFGESLRSGEALETGLKGLKGFAKGAIQDLPASIYAGAKTGADLLSFGDPERQVAAGRELFEGLRALPGHIAETTRFAGSRPEEFGRLSGQLLGQPAAGEAAVGGALGAARGLRRPTANLMSSVGRGLEGTPPIRGVPTTPRGVIAGTIRGVAAPVGRTMQRTGEAMRQKAFAQSGAKAAAGESIPVKPKAPAAPAISPRNVEPPPSQVRLGTQPPIAEVEPVGEYARRGGSGSNPVPPSAFGETPIPSEADPMFLSPEPPPAPSTTGTRFGGGGVIDTPNVNINQNVPPTPPTPPTQTSFMGGGVIDTPNVRFRQGSAAPEVPPTPAPPPPKFEPATDPATFAPDDVELMKARKAEVKAILERLRAKEEGVNPTTGEIIEPAPAPTSAPRKKRTKGKWQLSQPEAPPAEPKPTVEPDAFARPGPEAPTPAEPSGKVVEPVAQRPSFWGSEEGSKQIPKWADKIAEFFTRKGRAPKADELVELFRGEHPDNAWMRPLHGENAGRFFTTDKERAANIYGGGKEGGSLFSTKVPKKDLPQYQADLGGAGLENEYLVPESVAQQARGPVSNRSMFERSAQIGAEESAAAKPRSAFSDAVPGANEFSPDLVAQSENVLEGASPTFKPREGAPVSQGKPTWSDRIKNFMKDDSGEIKFDDEDPRYKDPKFWKSYLSDAEIDFVNDHVNTPTDPWGFKDIWTRNSDRPPANPYTPVGHRAFGFEGKRPPVWQSQKQYPVDMAERRWPELLEDAEAYGIDTKGKFPDWTDLGRAVSKKEEALNNMPGEMGESGIIDLENRVTDIEAARPVVNDSADPNVMARNQKRFNELDVQNEREGLTDAEYEEFSRLNDTIYADQQVATEAGHPVGNETIGRSGDLGLDLDLIDETIDNWMRKSPEIQTPAQQAAVRDMLNEYARKLQEEPKGGYDPNTGEAVESPGFVERQKRLLKSETGSVGKDIKQRQVGEPPNLEPAKPTPSNLVSNLVKAGEVVRTQVKNVGPKGQTFKVSGPDGKSLGTISVTNEEVAEVMRAYGEGHSPDEIAKLIYETQLDDILDKAKVKYNNQKMSDTELKVETVDNRTTKAPAKKAAEAKPKEKLPYPFGPKEDIEATGAPTEGAGGYGPGKVSDKLSDAITVTPGTKPTGTTKSAPEKIDLTAIYEGGSSIKPISNEAGRLDSIKAPDAKYRGLLPKNMRYELKVGETYRDRLKWVIDNLSAGENMTPEAEAIRLKEMDAFNESVKNAVGMDKPSDIPPLDPKKVDLTNLRPGKINQQPTKEWISPRIQQKYPEVARRLRESEAERARRVEANKKKK